MKKILLLLLVFTLPLLANEPEKKYRIIYNISEVISVIEGDSTSTTVTFSADKVIVDDLQNAKIMLDALRVSTVLLDSLINSTIR